jgi:polar amino acid transport system ATP-binding protein
MACRSMVVAHDVHKRYGDVEVLKGVDLEVNTGKVVCIIGASGAGKSTFLRCINHLEHPDQGWVLVDGQLVGLEKIGRRLHETSERHLCAARASIGMVFQRFNLFQHMTVLENVTLAPTLVKKESRRVAGERALALLQRVGLATKKDRYPRQLSGGEQQRVAIARALVAEPRLVLADEPTGNLDSRTGRTVLELLRTLNREQRVTVIMVTHGGLGTSVVDRTVELCDGRLVNGTHGREIRPPDTADDPAELSWVVWRDAQSVTEWEAIQLTAWGVSDATGWHGSMAEAG